MERKKLDNYLKYCLTVLVLSATAIAVSNFIWGRRQPDYKSYKPDLEVHLLTGTVEIFTDRMTPYPYQAEAMITYIDGSVEKLPVTMYDCGGDWKPDFGIVFGEKSKRGIVLERNSLLYPSLKEKVEELKHQEERQQNDNIL